MIFISYSWADASAFARIVHSRLMLSGHDVWIDYERLNLRLDLKRQLEQAVCSARLVLFLDSANARNSEWVNFELGCASGACVPVTSLRLG